MAAHDTAALWVMNASGSSALFLSLNGHRRFFALFSFHLSGRGSGRFDEQAASFHRDLSLVRVGRGIAGSFVLAALPRMAPSPSQRS